MLYEAREKSYRAFYSLIEPCQLLYVYVVSCLWRYCEPTPDFVFFKLKYCALNYVYGVGLD